MELRLRLILVICCATLRYGWGMDQVTQSLVDQLERSTATNFTTTSYQVYHMEVDLFRLGQVIYTERFSLRTSDGTSVTTVAGNATEGGYREGRGVEARFRYLYGFTQVTEKRIIVADKYNHCLRNIDRETGITSVLSGQCKYSGYTDGLQGKFKLPWSVIRDKNNDSQLLVSDYYNSAVRTVDVNTGFAGTFANSSDLLYVRTMTQEDNGDVYVVGRWHALYRITYGENATSLVSGSENWGYKDSSLLDSLFYYPHDLVFIGKQFLLVGDANNDRIRLVDMNTDKVSTLDLCSGCLYRPYSLLLTTASLYVRQKGGIQRFIYPQTISPTTAILPTSKATTSKPITIVSSTTSTTTIQAPTTAKSDNLLLRRMQMVARYDIKCTVLNDKVALSTLTNLADNHVNQILKICQHECRSEIGSRAKLTCKNDILTVSWPTDVTFNGAVTEIPDGLKQRVTDRLVEQSRSPILNMLVMTKIPPLVYPTKTARGAYAELVLVSSCLQNKIYYEKTDSCE